MQYLQVELAVMNCAETITSYKTVETKNRNLVGVQSDENGPRDSLLERGHNCESQDCHVCIKSVLSVIRNMNKINLKQKALKLLE